MCQNFLLDQDVLAGLLVDIIDNLSTDVHILIQDELLDEYIFLRVFQKEQGVAFSELITGQIEQAQSLTAQIKDMLNSISTNFILTAVEGADCGFRALHSLKELDKVLVLDIVLTDIKIVQSLMISQYFGELSKVAISEFVVLHGQLL